MLPHMLTITPCFAIRLFFGFLLSLLFPSCQQLPLLCSDILGRRITLCLESRRFIGYRSKKLLVLCRVKRSFSDFEMVPPCFEVFVALVKARLIDFVELNLIELPHEPRLIKARLGGICLLCEIVRTFQREEQCHVHPRSTTCARTADSHQALPWDRLHPRLNSPRGATKTCAVLTDIQRPTKTHCAFRGERPDRVVLLCYVDQSVEGHVSVGFCLYRRWY